MAEKLKKWLQPPEIVPVRHVPFEVHCACGQAARGVRQGTQQILPCSRCGENLFILPFSPLPSLDKPSQPGTAAPRAQWQVRHWLLPLSAVTLAVGGLIVLYGFLAPDTKNGTKPGDPGRAPQTAADRFIAAQKHFHAGNFRLAVLELEDGQKARLLEREGVSREIRLHWQQLHREAALLADLCSEPLEDILHHAAAVPEAEWEVDFRQRYQGKAILFDGEVKRLANGQLQWSGLIWGAAQPVRLNLDDLNLLKGIKLEQPRRLIFGARLAKVRHEPPWVIRLQPDSGAWITDATAAALCCPALAEEDARATLEKQVFLLAGGTW